MLEAAIQAAQTRQLVPLARFAQDVSSTQSPVEVAVEVAEAIEVLSLVPVLLAAGAHPATVLTAQAAQADQLAAGTVAAAEAVAAVVAEAVAAVVAVERAIS